MVRCCCIMNCHSRSPDSHGKSKEKHLGFYRIPAWKSKGSIHISELTRRRRAAWLTAIGRPSLTFHNTPVHMLVCSKHFHKGKPALAMLESDPDWTPSLNLGHTEVKAATTMTFQKLKGNVSPKQQPPTNTHTCQLETKVDNAPEIHEAQVCTETPADMQSERISLHHKDEEQHEYKPCGKMLKVIEHLLEENHKLKQKMAKKKLDEHFLKDNDAKVKFYTGLPSFALLMRLLMQIRPSLPNTDRKISHFQMLLLTLMCLRLNLSLGHVVHLFEISRKTASTMFNDTLNELYSHLSPLLHWPSRHCTKASVPHHHEMFGDRLTFIIDCFELFIETAQHLRAMQETYSTHKSRNSMKYLIGLTPQGTISFISNGWGGRSSDKCIAEKCGFLQRLSPGDIVLADQRFDIEESVSQMGATLKIPAFTQLQVKDVEKTQKLADVRLHVERVIGRLRSKYTILNDTIRLGLVVPCEGEEITLLDKIVTVSCALTNMCQSVALKQANDE